MWEAEKVSKKTKTKRRKDSLKNCKKQGRWWHCPVTPKPKVDKRSIRTVKRGRNLIRVACPSGKWNPKGRKGKQCKVGMVRISTLKPA